MSKDLANSDLLIGLPDDTTWLLTDDHTGNHEQIQPNHTLIISAAKPWNTLEQNHVNSIHLWDALGKNGFDFNIGWASNQPNLLAELTFCIPVPEPEAKDAIKATLIELTKTYGGYFIAEVQGNQVAITNLETNETTTKTKGAIKLAQTQGYLQELLKTLFWAIDPSEDKLANLEKAIDQLATNTYTPLYNDKVLEEAQERIDLWKASPVKWAGKGAAEANQKFIDLAKLGIHYVLHEQCNCGLQVINANTTGHRDHTTKELVTTFELKEPNNA